MAMPVLDLRVVAWRLPEEAQVFKAVVRSKEATSETAAALMSMPFKVSSAAAVIPPARVKAPVLDKVSWAMPEAEADKISVLSVWLKMATALTRVREPARSILALEEAVEPKSRSAVKEKGERGGGGGAGGDIQDVVDRAVVVDGDAGIGPESRGLEVAGRIPGIQSGSQIQGGDVGDGGGTDVYAV